MLVLETAADLPLRADNAKVDPAPILPCQAKSYPNPGASPSPESFDTQGMGRRPRVRCFLSNRSAISRSTRATQTPSNRTRGARIFPAPSMTSQSIRAPCPGLRNVDPPIVDPHGSVLLHSRLPIPPLTCSIELSLRTSRIDAGLDRHQFPHHMARPRTGIGHSRCIPPITRPRGQTTVERPRGARAHLMRVGRQGCVRNGLTFPGAACDW
jgi:hypothetical protein